MYLWYIFVPPPIVTLAESRMFGRTEAVYRADERSEDWSCQPRLRSVRGLKLCDAHSRGQSSLRVSVGGETLVRNRAWATDSCPNMWVGVDFSSGKIFSVDDRIDRRCPNILSIALSFIRQIQLISQSKLRLLFTESRAALQIQLVSQSKLRLLFTESRDVFQIQLVSQFSVAGVSCESAVALWVAAESWPSGTRGSGTRGVTC